MKLIVGLGNPGARYTNTRHNLGFQAVDILVSSYGNDIAKEPAPHGAAAEVWQHKLTKDIFIKPQSFMNESGTPVSIIASFFKVPSADLIVIHDELDLKLGVWQFKEGGSSAGHNGLRSLFEKLGSPDFSRYRLGIQTPEQAERKIPAEDFVLRPFDPEEEEAVGRMLSESTTDLITRLMPEVDRDITDGGE